MQALVVEFRVKPEFIDAFGVAIVDNARASLASEPGCRQFDVCRDLADAALFLLYELYDDEAAFQDHLQSAHFLQMNEITAPWVDSKKVWRLLRVSP
jgi:quinol monooxygenase YgiN